LIALITPTTKRQWVRLFQRFISALGLFAIPIGILAPLSPDWWEDNWYPVSSVALLALLWALLGLVRGEPKHDFRDHVTIRLVTGDLFEQDTSVMVGFTTTFDTSVPSIISPTSVQAALLERLFGGSHERLDDALDFALRRLRPNGTTISKPGKTVCYDLGSVATIELPDGNFVFCAAYTQMNSHNNASGTINSVLAALDATWEEANRVVNGKTISVPLIGQGQSRVPELSPEIAIRLIAFSFLLRSRRGRFSKELRIVIHPSDRGKVNYSEFQAFLRSIDA
jgi:hypothetical protein